MAAMTDVDDLVTRLSNDLDGVFPEVVRMMSGDLYSGAMRLLGHREDAEDVTQEAFVRAYRALRGYPPARIRSLRLRGWMWTITANLCRNRIRQRSRRTSVEMDTEPADPSSGPDESAVGADTARRLSEALLRLPWPQRAAVVMRHVADLPVPEIAEALDRPEGTVRSDIHRGLAALRAAYQEGS